MPKMKVGTATGSNDSKFDAIRVGDYIKAQIGGNIYEIDTYGRAMSITTGETVPLSSLDTTKFTKIDEEEVARETTEGLETEPVEVEFEDESKDNIDETIEEIVGLIPDDLIAQELRRRGFSGTLSKTITINI